MQTMGRKVHFLIGMLPEPLGYSLAKYSRSATPLIEWVMKLTEKDAQKFYDAYYFDYGDASIADLAHVPLSIDNISNVASTEIWDEALQDGQETSTRYYNFAKRGRIIPPEIIGTRFEERCIRVCDLLLDAYQQLQQPLLDHLEQKYASERPLEMKEDKYRRTLNARAFDNTRYLLPGGTPTGMGLLLSARTLERQLTRLFSHPLQEIRDIAAELKAAAKDLPAYNPIMERMQKDVFPKLDEMQEIIVKHLKEDDAREEMERRFPEECKKFPSMLQEVMLRIKEYCHADARVLPTLMKHAEKNKYMINLRQEVKLIARELLNSLAPDGRRGVELISCPNQNVEMAATLVYGAAEGHSFSQILSVIDGMGEPSRQDLISHLINLAGRLRGEHDPMTREAATGYAFIFDLCYDFGASRDLNRHRKVEKINQYVYPYLGYDIPLDILTVGAKDLYVNAVEQAFALGKEIEAELPMVSTYILPFATRRRQLLKMDARELQYIVELRSRPHGHFSYREIVYDMFLAFKEKYPLRAGHIRAHLPNVGNIFIR